jgi:hypothetical protein
LFLSVEETAMSNLDLRETFLGMVRDGAGYIATLSPTKEWKQWWCRDNDEIMAYANEYCANHNIYISLATFPNQFNTREAKFAEQICALWADIDRHEHSPYKTDDEIEVAIQNFLKKTGLPQPNIHHYTGHGIHIYWALSAAVHLAKWQQMADQLQALLDTLSVGADPITSDAARVLRLPGTLNFRDPTNPIETRLEILSRELVSVDALTSKLQEATKSFPPPKRAANQTHHVSNIPLTSDNVAIVKAMLDLIDPDPADAGNGNRTRWMQILWSIASTGWGEKAYDIARCWSEGGDLFDEAAFNSIWNSYDPEWQSGTKRGIGFGTLVHHAREAGYNGPVPGSLT